MKNDDIWFMNLALEEADKAYALDEVPVGAVIVSSKGEVLSQAHNLKEGDFNPCGHAEVLAIIEASKKLKSWRLTDATIYVTLEPCNMCMAAMVQARIGRLAFGAYDTKAGALSLGYNLHKDSRLNHSYQVCGGILHQKCSKLISRFFREKRAAYKFTSKK